MMELGLEAIGEQLQGDGLRPLTADELSGLVRYSSSFSSKNRNSGHAESDRYQAIPLRGPTDSKTAHTYLHALTAKPRSPCSAWNQSDPFRFSLLPPGAWNAMATCFRAGQYSRTILGELRSSKPSDERSKKPFGFALMYARGALIRVDGKLLPRGLRPMMVTVAVDFWDILYPITEK